GSTGTASGGARHILGSQHRQRKREAVGRSLCTSRRRISGESAFTENDFVCPDESGIAGVPRPHGPDFLHECADLLYRRTPPDPGAALLRGLGTGRISVSWALRIDFQDAG